MLKKIQVKRIPATLWSLHVCGFQLVQVSPSILCQKIV